MIDEINKTLSKYKINCNWFKTHKKPQDISIPFTTTCTKELLGDMGNMMGIDPITEFCSVLRYEIEIHIFTNIINELRNSTPNIKVVELDMENFKSLYEIGGISSVYVGSPNIVALIERLPDFSIDCSPITAESSISGIHPIGTSKGKYVFRETLCKDDFLMFLLNMDGTTPLVKCNIGDVIETDDGEYTIEITRSKIPIDTLQPKVLKCFFSKEFVENRMKLLYGDTSVFIY